MKRQNDRKLTKTDSMYIKLQYNNSTYSSIIITAPPSADPSLLHGGGSDSTNRTKPTLQQLMFHRIVNRLYHPTPSYHHHITIQYSTITSHQLQLTARPRRTTTVRGAVDERTVRGGRGRRVDQLPLHLVFQSVALLVVHL